MAAVGHIFGDPDGDARALAEKPQRRISLGEMPKRLRKATDRCAGV